MDRFGTVVLVILSALSCVGCMENDCGNPNNNALYRLIEERDLERRAAEDGPSVRWYWCEAPLKKGSPVPDGRLGPLVNLADGSDYGYGGWVHVLADDVSTLHQRLINAGVKKVGAIATKNPKMWPLTAAAVFGYAWHYEGPYQDNPPLSERLSNYGADTFVSWYAKTGEIPWSIQCFSVHEMQQRAQDFAECKAPAAKSPVTQPDESTTSSSASGGAPTPGDWGTN